MWWETPRARRHPLRQEKPRHAHSEKPGLAAENTPTLRRATRHELADGLRLYTREGVSRSRERAREGEWERKRAREREREWWRRRERKREYFLAESSDRARTSTEGKKKPRDTCHRSHTTCVCKRNWREWPGGKRKKKKNFVPTDMLRITALIHTQKCVFFFFLTPLIFLPRPAARGSPYSRRPCHSSWRDRSRETSRAAVREWARASLAIDRRRGGEERRWAREREREREVRVRWTRNVRTPPKYIDIFRNLLAILIFFTIDTRCSSDKSRSIFSKFPRDIFLEKFFYIIN